jgi:hypothetical protein
MLKQPFAHAEAQFSPAPLPCCSISTPKTLKVSAIPTRTRPSCSVSSPTRQHRKQDRHESQFTPVATAATVEACGQK